MGIKVSLSKVSTNTRFAVAAYTTLEYVGNHGSLTAETIKEAVAKEFPDLEPEDMIVVFDALVDSRLVAFMPSKALYRLSQSGKLAFSIAKAVVKAVAQAGSVGEEQDGDEEPSIH